MLRAGVIAEAGTDAEAGFAECSAHCCAPSGIAESAQAIKAAISAREGASSRCGVTGAPTTNRQKERTRVLSASRQRLPSR